MYVNSLLLESIDFFCFLPENEVMEGLTIKEMAVILGITPDAVKMRLHKAKITPITKDALYDPSSVDRIREVSKGGRPRKGVEEDE